MGTVPEYIPAMGSIKEEERGVRKTGTEHPLKNSGGERLNRSGSFRWKADALPQESRGQQTY